MIQINEKDTLWFFYTFFYKRSRKLPPAPNNLCNYFWTSLGGFFLWLFTESFFIFPILLLLGWGYISYLPFIVFDNSERGIVPLFKIMGVLSLVGTGFIGLLSLICRIVDFCEREDQEKAKLICFLTVVVGFFVTMTTLAVKGNDQLSVWHVGEAILWDIWLFVALVGGISLYVCLFTNQTNLGTNIVQFLKACKDKACPLVKPPESWQVKEREMHTNYTDS